MIRPVTCICFLLATGSGLYVYQAKHAAQVLDRKIEKTVRDTEAVRDQTRALRTEWTLLNEPDRLRQLAEQYLPVLRPIAPNQFTSLADLDSRLPAIQMPAPAAPEADPTLMADAADPEDGDAVASAGPTGGDATLAASEALPLPPPAPPPAPPPQVVATAAPIAAPVVTHAAAPAPAVVAHVEPATPAVRIAEHRPVVPKAIIPAALVQPQGPRSPVPDPRPVDVRPVAMRTSEPHASDSRPGEAARLSEQPRQLEQARAVEPRPASRPTLQARTAAPPYSPPTPAAPAGGSLLGMARGNAPVPAPLPLPRPIPVNAVSGQWPNGG